MLSSTRWLIDNLTLIIQDYREGKLTKIWNKSNNNNNKITKTYLYLKPAKSLALAIFNIFLKILLTTMMVLKAPMSSIDITSTTFMTIVTRMMRITNSFNCSLESCMWRNLILDNAFSTIWFYKSVMTRNSFSMPRFRVRFDITSVRIMNTILEVVISTILWKKWKRVSCTFRKIWKIDIHLIIFVNHWFE